MGFNVPGSEWVEIKNADLSGTNGPVYKVVSVNSPKRRGEIPHDLIPGKHMPPLVYDIRDGVLHAVCLPKWDGKGKRPRHYNLLKRQPESFFKLLLLYDAYHLVRVPSDLLDRMASFLEQEVVHSWDLLEAVIQDERFPKFPMLQSPMASQLQAPTIVQKLHSVYLLTGATQFKDLKTMAPEGFQTLLEANYINEEGKLTKVLQLEEQLVDAAKLTDLELWDFCSYHADLYEKAQSMGLKVLVPSKQALTDATLCGLTDVHHISAAMEGGLGAELVVIRAEQLPMDVLIKLMKVATKKLVLIGDKRQRLAFTGRAPMHGFALLCDQFSSNTKAWPMGLWQDRIQRDLHHGTSVNLSINHLGDWSRLPQVVPNIKKALVFCPSEGARVAAMRALKINDTPWMNLSFSVPSLGLAGEVKKVDTKGRAWIHGEPHGKVRRADVELYTAFLGTRRPHVIALVDETVCIQALVGVLKHAEESFRIFVVPGSGVKRLTDLQEDFESLLG